MGDQGVEARRVRKVLAQSWWCGGSERAEGAGFAVERREKGADGGEGFERELWTEEGEAAEGRGRRLRLGGARQEEGADVG